MTEGDRDRVITYPLRWPAWLANQAAEAANARTMSVAVWLRQAVQEKLERDGHAGADRDA